MSQAALTTSAARPPVGGGGEGPDLLFVIRHYRWILVIGALIGLLVGSAVYTALLFYAPKYSATTTFRVWPPENPITPDRAVSSEDAGAYLRMQMQAFLRDEFLESALKKERIRAKRWYQNAQPSAKAALKRSFDVSAVPGAQLFRVKMTIAEREEVAEILDEMADVYLTDVKNANAAELKVRTEALQKARDTQYEKVTRARTELETFRKERDINAMLQSHTIARDALNSLYMELMRARIDYVNARKNLDTLLEEAKKADYRLPLEVQQQVENDPQLRALDNERLSLERELIVTIAQYGEGHKSARMLKDRIDAVNLQMKKIREQVTDTTKQRYVASTELGVLSLDARIKELQKNHDAKQEEVRRLDSYLVTFRQMESDLREQEKIFQDLDGKLTMEILKQSGNPVRVTQWAKPSQPAVNEITSPTLMTFLPGGLGTGLVLAFVLAYVLELTNTRVRTPRDITRTMQLPLLGFVPDQQDDDFHHGNISTTVRDEPGSMIAESFRQIRGRLAAQSDGPPLRSLLVAAVAPGGGATTVASNLANGVALNGRRVLLVDANFYRPGLRSIYRDLPSTGFSDVLADPSKLDSAIVQNTQLPTLYVMGGGTQSSTASSHLLDNPVTRDVIARMKEKFDMVIIDGAPLSLVSDSISLAAKVDGVIAIVRAGRTTRGTVGRVREQLRQVKAQLLGVILNAAQTQRAGYFKENYRTFYLYAANGHAAAEKENVRA